MEKKHWSEPLNLCPQWKRKLRKYKTVEECWRNLRNLDRMLCIIWGTKLYDFRRLGPAKRKFFNCLLDILKVLEVDSSYLEYMVDVGEFIKRNRFNPEKCEHKLKIFEIYTSNMGYCPWMFDSLFSKHGRFSELIDLIVEYYLASRKPRKDKVFKVLYKYYPRPPAWRYVVRELRNVR